MPRDERQRQKALMKKRSKQKAVSKTAAAFKAATSVSSKSLIRNARHYPLLECWISPNWESTEHDSGLVQVVVARKQPDDDICFGAYLIDKFCLGLKNTMAHAGLSRHQYEEDMERFRSRIDLQQCAPELAHQIVYAGIEYAAQFGFEPEKDFALSQYMLEPRGELPESYKLTFGRDGKPFFVAGPYDNVARVLRQLEKTVGVGNFDFVAPIDDPFDVE